MKKILLLFLAVILTNSSFAQEEKSLRFIFMMDDNLGTMYNSTFSFIKDSVQYDCDVKYDYGCLSMTADNYQKISEYKGMIIFRFSSQLIEYEIPFWSSWLRQRYTIFRVYNRNNFKYKRKYPRFEKNKKYYYCVTIPECSIYPVNYKDAKKEKQKVVCVTNL